MEHTRHVLALALALVAGSIAHAQHLYMQVHGSWQQPIGGLPTANISSTTTNTGSSSSERESVLFNFGKGAGGGLLLGGRLCGAFSWETRFTYMPGATNKTEYHSGSSFGTVNSTTEMTCKLLSVEPALRLSTGDSTHRWYMAFGPSLALMPVLTERYTSTNAYDGPIGPFTSTEDRTGEYTGGFGCGVFGAIGYLHQCRGRLGFFVELNATARSWSPARFEITKYTVNGVDELGQLSTSERETEYMDEYTVGYPQDINEPDKSTKIQLPMSSFGVRAGLHLVLAR